MVIGKSKKKILDSRLDRYVYVKIRELAQGYSNYNCRNLSITDTWLSIRNSINTAVHGLR